MSLNRSDLVYCCIINSTSVIHSVDCISFVILLSCFSKMHDECYAGHCLFVCVLNSGILP